MTQPDVSQSPLRLEAVPAPKISTSVYRAAALTRLSSPERLDLGARVVRPATWLLLFALGLIIVSAAAATVFVKVPIKAEAKGMLISPEGLKEVVSTSAGQIKTLSIKAGDFVHAGQDVALIAQPDAGVELASAVASAGEAANELDRVTKFQSVSGSSLEKMRTAQGRDLQSNLSFADKRIKMLEERRQGQELLLAHGYLAKDRLVETRVEIGTAEVERAKLETQIKQLEADALSEKIQRDREMLALQFKVSDTKRQVENATEKLNRLVSVKSPYTGTVAELKVNEGEVVGSGTAMFSVFPQDSPTTAGRDHSLVAALYVPQSEGKKVRPGMMVQIVPSTIKREEYGFMIGRIVSVADLPSTSEGMMRTLKNQQIVQSLSGEGAPFQVTAVVEKSAKTPSGYLWSSSKGPDSQISHATPCDAEIVLKTASLLTFIMPAVHKFVGDVD